MKIHTSVMPFCQRIGCIFLHEQLWPGQPETINTLFHISYHKQVVPSVRFPGNTGKNHLLYQVAVLIFIDHDLLKIICKIPGCLGTLAVPVFSFHQNLQRQMLQIMEIAEIPSSFFFFISSGELHRQIQQLFHHRCTGPHLPVDLLRCGIKIGFF